MAVSPQDVKKLRDMTDAGMLDCKKALIEANGDFKAAEKILKEKGLASADKRSGRATTAGSIFTATTDTHIGIVELSCETDFVAKTDQFQECGKKIAKLVAEKNLSSSTEEVDLAVKDAIGILKENMGVKNIQTMERTANDSVAEYQHNNGKIGVVVKLSCDSAATADKTEVKELGFDLALHAAAFNPAYLNREKVDQSYLAEQESIFKTQAEGMDKPENVVAGIIKGKLNKHLAQICFVDQKFVKNDKVTVKQACDEVAKKVGGSIELSDFVYIMVGQE